jgi:hypothetical protein
MSRIVVRAEVAGALLAGEGWELNRNAQPTVATNARIGIQSL